MGLQNTLRRTLVYYIDSIWTVLNFIYYIQVLHQPVHGAKVVVGLKPDNYMAFSLISFLCCCHCIGLAALIYSLQVSTMNYSNRISLNVST